MSKKIVWKKVRLILPAGKATVAPPVGSMLGQYGINMMDFCKKFNEETKTLEVNTNIPVLVNIFKDKTFTFKIRTPHASFLLKKLYQVHKTYHIKSVSLLDLYKIAHVKSNTELETKRLMQSLVGSCKSMGLKITNN